MILVHKPLVRKHKVLIKLQSVNYLKIPKHPNLGFSEYAVVGSLTKGIL